MEEKLTRRLNHEGINEWVNDKQEVVYVEKPPKKSMARARRKNRAVVDTNVVKCLDRQGNVILASSQLDLDRLPGRKWNYAQHIGDFILMHVTEGKTLREIASMEGMPPAHIMYRWTREFPEFKEHLEIAKRDRASYFHDKAIEVAMDVETKTDAITAKVKIDTLKWAAERGSPSEYGNKTVHEGNPDKPITILVDTGIYREIPGGLNGEIEKVVESKVEDGASGE